MGLQLGEDGLCRCKVVLFGADVPHQYVIDTSSSALGIRKEVDERRLMCECGVSGFERRPIPALLLYSDLKWRCEIRTKYNREVSLRGLIICERDNVSLCRNIPGGM